jgi:hypothetical protein
MKHSENKGFDSSVIEDYRAKIKLSGQSFLSIDSAENSDEYAHFYFVGKFEGKEVIYDAALYTLRLHHESELFEIAERKAAQHFPGYQKINYKEDEKGNLQQPDELEEEIGLYIAEVIAELEEEDQVKVREHVDLDLKIEFGIGLDAGLQVEKMTAAVINQFVKVFNENKLALDETLYSFQMDDEEPIG